MNLFSDGMLFSLFAGIALAASVGFRVFLPLLVLSAFSYFFKDLITLSDDMLWLSNPTVVLIIALVAIAEIVSYYIPVLENKLDKFKLFLSAIAGVVVIKATLIGFTPVLSWIIALLVGVSVSVVVSYSLSLARKITVVTTHGVGNFLINSAEIVGALVLSITAILISPLAFLVAVILITLMIKALMRIEKRTFDTYNQVSA